MQHAISITGGAAADGSPLTNPETVNDVRCMDLRERISETDEQPCALWLSLHGTAGNTAVVSIWTCWDPETVERPNRKWALVKSGITVTVGEVTRAPACPGRICIQVTTSSAANSELRVKVSSQPYATPVS